MEPRIQYARTSDGVNIAYYTLGQGALPLVYMEMPLSHLHAEWQQPRKRLVYENIATQTQLVRYDHRGFGLSDPTIETFSVESLVLDLEAVCDRIGAERFALISTNGNTAPAVAYAVRHPDRVARLVLGFGMVRFPTSYLDQLEALLQSPDANWKFVSESWIRMTQGWDEHQVSREDAAMLREAISLDGFRRWVRDLRGWDATELLPLLRAPTLAVYYHGLPFWDESHAREIAALAPHVQVAIADGSTLRERQARGNEAVARFLGGRLPTPEAAASLPSGTAIILFADIVDSTALTERMGDAAFRDRARALDAALRSIIAEAGGAAIDGKLLGDGVLATFSAASQAIDAALRCGVAGDAQSLPLHLGLHAGDVIREANNVFGGAVNIASRISALSAPGEVLVSDIVRGLARTSAGVTFEDRGEHALKGVADPQRVYAVQVRE
jgi:class 3 adenylate cyclase